MSVTFQVEAIHTGAFAISCWETGSEVEVARAGSYAAISDELIVHKAGCDECAAYGCYPAAVLDVDVSVNFANGNARALGFALDLELGEDLSGEVAAEELLARLAIARALDTGSQVVRPTVDARGAGARMIECGIDADYVASAFERLEHVATVARDLGRPVQWA
jgi:hypothetical protein